MAMEFIAPQRYFARPYSQLASTYDIALGIPNFIGTRAAFERLVRRYDIRFRSAADIGCGTGLFACYLNQCWGVPVFGVDRSPEMLAVATRNCTSSNVCLLQQDIRCLRLPYPVDLITANFDTMNHLLTELDLRLAFRRIWERVAVGLAIGTITCQNPPGERGHDKSSDYIDNVRKSATRPTALIAALR